MKDKIALKRIGAYLIDFILISIVSMIITSITFINPKHEEYTNISEEYNNVLNQYYEDEIDINEFNELTKNMSYEISKTGYVYIIGDIVVAFLYFGVFAYFMHGQTLGKKLMNIKIVSNKDNKDLKIYNYFIRVFILNSIILNIVTLIAINFSKNTYFTIYNIAANFDSILLIAILLMIFFNKNGRGIHDILAGTKVIDLNEKSNIEEVEILKPKKNDE